VRPVSDTDDGGTGHEPEVGASSATLPLELAGVRAPRKGPPPVPPRAAAAAPDPAAGADTAPLDVATIYDQHVDFVWRSLRRLGVPDRLVDDAVQDVFIVVHRRLAEFEYRFNRRYDLPAMIPRLGWVAARTPPMPYRLLKLAEDYG